MKVAIVHPWFISRGGAEAVVEALALAFPEADIFTFAYDQKYLPKVISDRKIVTLGLNWVPANTVS